MNYTQKPRELPTRCLRISRAPTTPVETEVQRLRRELEIAKAREHSAFDRGFQAALTMVERGATKNALRAASGVVLGDWEGNESYKTDYVSYELEIEIGVAA